MMTDQPQGVVFDEAFWEGLEWIDKRPKSHMLPSGTVFRERCEDGSWAYHLSVWPEQQPSAYVEEGWAWLIPQSHAEALECAEKFEALAKYEQTERRAAEAQIKSWNDPDSPERQALEEEIIWALGEGARSEIGLREAQLSFADAKTDDLRRQLAEARARVQRAIDWIEVHDGEPSVATADLRRWLEEGK